MRLRFYTLFNVLLPELKFVKKTIVLLAVTFYCPLFSQNVSVEDIKKEANQLFEDDEFTKAYKLFSQLVSNYPKDPEYNFKLGVCMIYSEPDKKKCLPYLNFANSKPDEAPKEVKFYLGKAYHINYLFDEAIKYYNEYKQVGSSAKQRKLQVDREIISCGYGKRLLSNLSDLEIKSKKQLNEIDYFRSYDLKDIGGKLLIKPETFRTGADKRKKEKSVVYLPRTADKVFFSSYGDNTGNKDIYYAVKLANGEFAKPVKLNGINTDYDEDYPFLHPNGKTLYFASKGHNSMGGYDIFKADYIESNDSWTQPVNLEFPINSPDDDYLYVTDSLEKVAYFSTGRQSPPGKIDVLKINTERKIIDILALKGTVVKESSEQSLRSKITVKNMGNGEIVGVFEAGENGDYNMDLPNGAKLLYTVETPGLKTQSERVGLPLATSSRPLKQTVSYDKGILKIINYFEESPTDDSYLQYLKLIEKKSKLDVNEGQNKLGPQLENSTANNTDINSANTNTTGPTIIDGGMDSTTKVATAKTATTNTTKGVSNKELADIAKQDANDSKKEANQLDADSWDAEQLGEQKKIEADKKMNEANELLKNAQTIANEEEKNKQIEQGNAIKTEAENDLAVANKILDFANKLKEDAANKKKEAILNEQYAAELEKINANKNKDNKESLAKLEDLQKQINDLATKENSSENLYKTIKNDIEEKEKQITAIEKTNTTITSNLNEIKTEVTNSEAELEKTRKKKDKEVISNQITELKADQTEKEKQIAQNQTELKKLNDELANLKNELELTNKIKTETIAAVKTNSINNNSAITNDNGNAINTNTSTSANASQKITDKTLEEKYKDKIIVTDVNSVENIQLTNKQLTNYNKEIDAAITKNKKDLVVAKTPATKQQLTNEIKLLETSKKDNNQLIANNNKQIQTINADIAKNGNATNANEKTINLTPIAAKNSSEALKNLDALNEQLGINDNANFEFNAYQNTDAQKTKIDADSKINDAAAQQKKLKDLITAAKEEIQKADASNNASNGNSVTSAQLLVEAEEFFNKSQKLKNDAQTKTGDERGKLLTEAKILEDKGNDKNLQAAEIAKNDNNALYTTNLDNINTLIAAGKSSEADITEAKKMNDEAALAFKQAAAIREEANSLPNIGAKLGSMSNAEEKEAWALNKQQQALDLLKKSNPNANLKTAITSTSSIKVVKEDININARLETVNNGLNELAATKMAAYQKLYEANTLELEQLNTNLKANENIILNTPSLKSESIAAANKVAAATTLKQKSDAGTTNNDKLNDLIAATKKQIEAINQYNGLSKKVNNQLASNTVNTTTANSTSNNNSTANNTTNSINTTSANTTNTNSTVTTAVNTNTSTGSAINSNTTANTTNTAAINDNSTNTNTTIANNTTAKTVDTKTVGINDLNKTDTTATQVVAYFENKQPATLKNPQATRLKNNAITELKNTEEENKAVENEIKAYKEQNPANTANATVTPAELKTKADALLIEAEGLSNNAAELKNKAAIANGNEKDSLIAKANELENNSQSKKTEASNLNEQGNELEYKTNNTAITELLTKLKADNPNLNTVLEQKNNEVVILKEQAKKLREEANAQTNTAAKLGAISNAEEKEAELLIKQTQLINELKKQYPDYVIKQIITDNATSNSSLPPNLVQKQKQVQDKQTAELTNLTNALSLEYETEKTYVPKNLTPEQKIVKQNADQLNAESKRLLIKSTTEQNPAEKAKLLTLAAKAGDAAVNQLSKITGDKVVSPNNNANTIANNSNTTNPRNNNNTTNNNTANNNTNPRNNNNTTNNNTTNNNTANNTTNPRNNNNTANNTTNPRNNNNNNTINPAVNNTKGTVKIEGLEVVSGNAYNAAKPIPLDAKMQDGLVFRVQIGAFKNQLANDAFKGLSPLNGETVGNGYIRYTAGNFVKFENASAVKNDLRNLGYNDAFVVAYFNGKRITLAEAIELLNKEGKMIDNNASTTAGITANSNVPKATTVVAAQTNYNSQEPVIVTKELEKVNGLLFTVQIGVYNKQVTKGQLKNLGPVFSERLPNGLYRYTAGIYSDLDKLLTDRRRVTDNFVRDAFISAYLNGKRISFADGKDKKTNDSTIKLEPQNPIVFPAATPLNTTPVTNTPIVNTPVNNTPVVNTPVTNNTPAVNTTNVQPFTNGVTSYPAATAENGIKPNEEGVSFKVQIGAYSKQIPNDVAARFSAIKNWPIENKQINGLFIYNIGNFTEAKFAKSLKDQAIAAGITDAFITVYKDGKKVYGAEATSLLNR